MIEILEYINSNQGMLLERWVIMNLQVAVFAGVVWIIDSSLKSASPRLRYLLWMAALIKSMVPPVFSIPDTSGVATAVVTLPAVTASIFSAPASGGLSMHMIVIVLMAFASAALGIVAVLRYLRLRFSLRDAVPFGDAATFEEKAESDVTWPKLLVSSRIFSPLVVGLIKPRIYLTEEIAQGPLSKRRAVLFHELAHIRRGDRFVVLLQTVLQILYVLNPMVWLINLRLFRYRELICDEFAVKQTAMKPQDYGRVLLDFAERYSKPVIDMQLGTCFFETRRGFVQRISILLSNNADRRFSAKQIFLIGMAAALILPLSWQCSTKDQPGNVVGSNRVEDPGPGPSERSVSDDSNGLADAGSGNEISSADLETPAQIIGGLEQLQKNMIYPEEAIRKGIEGMVLYELSIAADGDQVKSIRVVKSAHPLLDAAGQAAIRATEFSAGRKDGKPVDSRMMLPIKFKLN